MVIWDGATIEQRTFSSRIKDSSAAAHDDRGATAPPTLFSTAAKRETTTTTTTIMTTTITSPVAIQSMGAVVPVPHLAHRGFDVLIVITALSCAVCRRAEARAFERHRHIDVRAFVLGRGRRDDGANGINTDDIIC